MPFEGVQEDVLALLFTPHALEHGQTVFVAANSLPIDQAGPGLEVVHGLDDQGVAVSPVVAVPGQQPDADGIATSHQPIAIVLDLVGPVRTRRRARSGGR